MLNSEASKVSYKSFHNFREVLHDNSTPTINIDTLELLEKKRKLKWRYKFIACVLLVILLIGGPCLLVKQVFYPEESMWNILKSIKIKTLTSPSDSLTNISPSSQRIQNDAHGKHQLSAIKHINNVTVEIPFPNESTQKNMVDGQNSTLTQYWSYAVERKKRNISNETFASEQFPTPDINAVFSNLSALHKTYNFEFEKFSNIFKKQKTYVEGAANSTSNNVSKEGTSKSGKNNHESPSLPNVNQGLSTASESATAENLTKFEASTSERNKPTLGLKGDAFQDETTVMEFETTEEKQLIDENSVIPELQKELQDEMETLLNSSKTLEDKTTKDEIEPAETNGFSTEFADESMTTIKGGVTFIDEHVATLENELTSSPNTLTIMKGTTAPNEAPISGIVETAFKSVNEIVPKDKSVSEKNADYEGNTKLETIETQTTVLAENAMLSSASNQIFNTTASSDTKLSGKVSSTPSSLNNIVSTVEDNIQSSTPTDQPFTDVTSPTEATEAAQIHANKTDELPVSNGSIYFRSSSDERNIPSDVTNVTQSSDKKTIPEEQFVPSQISVRVNKAYIDDPVLPNTKQKRTTLNSSKPEEKDGEFFTTSSTTTTPLLAKTNDTEQGTGTSSETEEELENLLREIIEKNSTSIPWHKLRITLENYVSSRNLSNHTNSMGKRSLKDFPEAADLPFKVRCYQTITDVNGKTTTKVINLSEYIKLNDDFKTRFPRSDIDELPPFSAHSLDTHKYYAGYIPDNTSHVMHIGNVQKPTANATADIGINYYCIHESDRKTSIDNHNDTNIQKIKTTLDELLKLSFSDLENELCNSDEKLCADKSQCISTAAWCNGIVNCIDRSDEINCSCKDRMDKEKLCDGYFDCPDGDDEEGCFGCSKDHFSCEDWSKYHLNSTCVPISSRCDGILDCSTHKDEKDCELLADKVYSHDTFFVSYTSGYLHRNWKGKWYPVCTDGAKDWAKKACESELGVRNVRNVEITERTFTNYYDGSFITETGVGIAFQEICNTPSNAIYVKCPSDHCGSRIRYNNDMLRYRYRRFIDDTQETLNTDKTSQEFVKKVEKLLRHAALSETLATKVSPSRIQRSIIPLDTYEDADNATIRVPRGEDERVVGGKVSGPGSWPWLVALYKNGVFHCGGVILDDSWIMTAAHCVQRNKFNFFEVQAGILRRLSFSPMEQIRTVSHVLLHESYSRTDMTNDLALLKLRTPLKLNRWVRPICLPEGRPPWGPKPGIKCTAVGWGATQEHGPDPDNMREVEVPILPECKHLSDKEGHELCAGYLYGEHDTCQGDSGGPLLCKIPRPQDRWYVAGIVSHGEGCARPLEPGVYTRVALYLPWLLEKTDDKHLVDADQPLQKCPGMQCKDDGRCIAKRKICDQVIDCLNAEDELNCDNWKNKLQESEFPGSLGSPDTNLPLFKNNDDTKYNYGVDTNQTTTEIIDIEFNGLDDMKINKSTIIQNTMIANLNNSAENMPESMVNLSDSKVNTTDSSLEDKKFEYLKNMSNIVTLDIFIEDNFTCKIVEQIIPAEWFCNGEVDCEDGTDEINCTCADMLRSYNKSLVCNGVIDCYNFTDEINCQNCTKNEFRCYESSSCINQTLVCDGKKDCHNGEDEKHCYVLQSNDQFTTDVLGIPVVTHEGLVTINKNGVWSILCQKADKIVPAKVEEICQSLGYVGFKNFDKIKINNVDQTIYGTASCYGIEVTCKPSRYDQHIYLPWHANIYINGHLQCIGLLLTPEWIVAEQSCYARYNETKDFAVTVLGGNKFAEKLIQSHGEQTVTVNLMTKDKDLNVTFIHLRRSVNSSKYVNPLELALWTPDHEIHTNCLLLGTDKMNRVFALKLDPKPCSENRCYQARNKTELCSHVNNTAFKFSGVVCSTKSEGWYLSAAISYELTSYCAGQNEQLKLKTWYNPDILDSERKIERKKLPVCEKGYRCALGKCIPWSAVCDGKTDCRNNEDEGLRQCTQKSTICRLRPKDCNCQVHEFQCKNHKCIPLSKYCNNINDCGDNSDEPTECSNFSCATYLNVTSPHKLCDSKRDCEDKSDENENICSYPCNSTLHFKCPKSGKCIPMDFVCDGETDCSHGEDEAKCIELDVANKTINEPTLKIRSNGIWQYDCIASDITGFNPYIACLDFGYENMTEFQYIPVTMSPLKEFIKVKLNEHREFRIKSKSSVHGTEPCNTVHLNCK